MAETTTFILIIDKDGNGIRYNRKGEIIQEKTWYGPEFTSGQYKETKTGSLQNPQGISTEIERTGNVPPNFSGIIKNTATITATQQIPVSAQKPAPAPATSTAASPLPASVSVATTAPARSTTPKPFKVGQVIPESATKPKPNPTKTTYIPKIGAVYKIPAKTDPKLPNSQQYNIITVLSPTEAKLTRADGTSEFIELTAKDSYPILQKYADKGWGPPLVSVIVNKDTQGVVKNTGEVPQSTPESSPTVSSGSGDFSLPQAVDYKDRSKTDLLNDIEITNGLLSDSINGLQNIVIDPDVTPVKTLYDRIREGGVTPELREKYGEQIDDYLRKLEQKKAILEAVKEKQKNCPPASENNASWSAERECSDGFNYSQLRALEDQYEKEIRDAPDPCGKSTLAGINNALLKFFEFLKGVKKYYNLYVNGAIGKIRNLSSIIAKTSDIIASVLKLLVQRMRNFIVNLLRKLIEKAINKIFTSLTKALKNTVIKAIIDSLLCAFTKIIDGLSALVSDFLFSLIGNVINTAFCAVEQFTNALINNLSAQIDKTLGPILNGINDVLGGVAKVAGSVFQAIDFILGFESFLCAKPDCPQIKSFKADAWAGPTPSMIEAFNNFLPIPDGAQAENWVLDQVDQFLDKNNVLTGATIFGDKYSDLDKNISGKDQALLGPCNTGAWRCGPPQVEFFGGGGAGAVGKAVVNNIGEVLGVNLFYGGEGYTSPPFVTFKDNCGSGNFASGYTIINDSGEVIKVIMVNSGTGYLPAPTGVDEFGIEDEEFGQQIVNDTREYVACLDEIEIIATGIGYSSQDSVSITPDVPGLQVKIQMTEIGQIVAMEVISAGCGVIETPEITINSSTGAGLQVRPILSFYDKNEYVTNIERRPDFNAENLVQVIQCVYN